MADVFEEDEEENEDVEGSDEPRDAGFSDETGVGMHVVDIDEQVDGLGMVWSVEAEDHRGLKRKGSGLSELQGHRADSIKSQDLDAATPPTDDALEAHNASVEIANDEEPPRASSVTKSSDSTITPPVMETLSPGSVSPSPLDLTGPGLVAPYLMPDTPSMTNSSFSSPDFHRGSFDVPRTLTSASSFTDDQLPTLLMMGEPGPELRISVDDVPSLTSSSSTMTSAANTYAGPYSMLGDERGRGHRASMSSSALSGRPRSRRSGGVKRSSLVSLSRLVGASHAEKSKLSIEEKAQPDAAEKISKEKKVKRLSRLMHFWKPKEAT